jgi:hypothetical protein
MPEAMSRSFLPSEHSTYEPLAETAMFSERAATPLERWARMARGASGELESARDSRGPVALGVAEEEVEVESDDVAIIEEAVSILARRPRRRSSAGAAVAAMGATMRAISMSPRRRELRDSARARGRKGGKNPVAGRFCTQSDVMAGNYPVKLTFPLRLSLSSSLFPPFFLDG